MNQPDPLYPGLSAGTCVTKVAGDLSKTMSLTVSNTAGPMLVITPDGKLQMPGIRPSEAADLLIEAFGRSYGSQLLIAEARALAAETLNRTLERRVKDAEDRARLAEKHLKRGMVDVLANDPPPKNRLLGRYARREMSSDKERQDATSDDKDDADDESG